MSDNSVPTAGFVAGSQYVGKLIELYQKITKTSFSPDEFLSGLA